MGIGSVWCELSSDRRDVMCINVFANCDTGMEFESVNSTSGIMRKVPGIVYRGRRCHATKAR